MFELYALTAGILLPTGLFTFLFFVHQAKIGEKNPSLWTFIAESVSTIFLGIFYVSSAVVLSRNFNIEETGLMDNHIEDVAIIMNDSLSTEAVFQRVSCQLYRKFGNMWLGRFQK